MKNDDGNKLDVRPFEHHIDPEPLPYDRTAEENLGDPPYLPNPTTGYNPHHHRRMLFRRADRAPDDINPADHPRDVNIQRAAAVALRTKLGIVRAARIRVYFERSVLRLSGKVRRETHALAMETGANVRGVVRIDDQMIVTSS